MVARIKKNDTVMVISGKDKGKTGSVISVLPKDNKVMVKGVGLVTKHVRAKRQGEVAGIKRQESYIPLCKVMPICPSTNKVCRVGAKLTEDGKRIRVSHRSKETF